MLVIRSPKQTSRDAALAWASNDHGLVGLCLAIGMVCHDQRSAEETSVEEDEVERWIADSGDTHHNTALNHRNHDV